MLLPQAHLHAHTAGPEPPSTDFILVVQTTGAGETFQLGAFNNGTYDAVVDWGDGQQSTITAYNDADLTHTYANAGNHEIKISGDFPAFQGNIGDQAKIIEVKNFGDIGRTRLIDNFRDVNNAAFTATDDIYLSATADAVRMFQNATDGGLVDLRGWNASYLRQINSIFNQSYANYLIANWDVSNVTTLNSTFRLTTIDEDMSAWNMSRVTNTGNIFVGTTSMSQANVDNFLYALWVERNNFIWASPNLNISSLVTPSGVYQDPQGTPTTGLEYVYVLENDPDAEGFNTWSITY